MSKIKSFNNKVIIITGSSSGLGKQLAMDFAKQQAKIVLVSRSEDKLNDVEQLISDEASGTLVVPADITNSQDIQRVVEKTVEKFGRIDILVNNAGIEKMSKFENLTHEEIAMLANTNFTGPAMLMNSVLPIMQKQGAGHIINIGSIVTYMPTSYQEVYSGAKFALRGITKTLNFTYKKQGINFSILESPAISGGGIMDRMVKSNNFKIPKIFPTVPVEVVSKHVQRAIKKRKEVVPLMMTPLFMSNFMILMMKLFPFMGKMMLKKAGMLNFMTEVAAYRIENKESYQSSISS